MSSSYDMFENAKMGDKFRTLDERMAVYLKRCKSRYIRHALSIDGDESIYRLYDRFGTTCGKVEGTNIVGKYKQKDETEK